MVFLLSWCFMSIMTISAQNVSAGSVVTLTGTVLDKSSEPLPGASVLVKGTSNGVATDVDGKFKIRLQPTSSTVLVFSFVGMKPREIPYSAFKDGAKVVLEDDSNSLDNVVVTGYANIRKDSFTGTSTTVGREDLMKVSPNNLMKALSAFDPSFKMITDNAQAVEAGVMYLRVRSLAMFILPVGCCCKSVLNALGKPLFPTLSGILEIAVRYAAPLVLVAHGAGFLSVPLTDAVAWTAIAVFLALAYLIEMRKIERTDFHEKQHF